MFQSDWCLLVVAASVAAALEFDAHDSPPVQSLAFLRKLRSLEYRDDTKQALHCLNLHYRSIRQDIGSISLFILRFEALRPPPIQYLCNNTNSAATAGSVIPDARKGV